MNGCTVAFRKKAVETIDGVLHEVLADVSCAPCTTISNRLDLRFTDLERGLGSDKRDKDRDVVTKVASCCFCVTPFLLGFGEYRNRTDHACITANCCFDYYNPEANATVAPVRFIVR